MWRIRVSHSFFPVAGQPDIGLSATRLTGIGLSVDRVSD
jgi:hypothetical protein